MEAFRRDHSQMMRSKISSSTSFTSTSRNKRIDVSREMRVTALDCLESRRGAAFPSLLDIAVLLLRMNVSKIVAVTGSRLAVSSLMAKS